jgi:hypothetical protein
VRDTVTVPVPPAATVREVMDGVIDGPADAAITETEYATVEVETDVTAMSKLRVIPAEGSSPKLKLA